MRKRRSKDKVLHEILSICSKGENLTQIIYRSNTNVTVVRYFIESLINKGLLEKINGSPVIYMTTPKGQDFRRRLKVHLDQMNGVFRD